MKIILSIFILCCLFAHCHAQDGWVCVGYGISKRVPMIEGVVTSNEYRGTRIIDYSQGLTIKSKWDSVFSIADGTVASIFTLDSSEALILKDKKENFYSYFLLKNASVVKGQAIRRGDFLGAATRTAESGLFELTLMMNDKVGMEIDAKILAPILKMGNSR